LTQEIDTLALLSHLDKKFRESDDRRSAALSVVHSKLDSLGREQSSFGAKLEAHLDLDDSRFSSLDKKIENQVGERKEEKREQDKEWGQWARTTVTVLFSSVAAYFINLIFGRNSG
jgi:hypothetical protein